MGVVERFPSSDAYGSDVIPTYAIMAYLAEGADLVAVPDVLGCYLTTVCQWAWRLPC